MAGVNKVILVGRLGKNPETKSFANGGSGRSLPWRHRKTGATSSPVNARKKQKWHNIVIRNENIGKVAQQYLRKGSEMYIEGAITTRKWQDQSGADRYTTEIVVGPFKGELSLIGGRDCGGGGGGGGGGMGGSGDRGGYCGGDDYGAPAGDNNFSSAAKRPAAFDEDLNDDVPF